jgi:hypothetical protein
VQLISTLEPLLELISICTPSAATTLEVIKDMITRPNQKLPGGIPSIVIPDNGVEFKNNALERVCEQLKITLTPSSRYT